MRYVQARQKAARRGNEEEAKQILRRDARDKWAARRWNSAQQRAAKAAATKRRSEKIATARADCSIYDGRRS
jgi:hypothetical protein